MLEKTKKTENKSPIGIFRLMMIGLLIFFPLCLMAQTGNQVTGTIVDHAGEPLIGVTVTVKGTTKGAATDIDGKFSIEAAPNATIAISYIGFKTTEIAVGNKKNLGEIKLEEDSKLLSEVVVVGYGTMEKRAVTSSISSVTSDDMVAGVGGATIATALQGKVTGLTISGLGSPNAAGDIQLRGLASIKASQGPLVVIDGIPGGDIRSLNQEDIQSIDVLKDASAGAIYGTRAAGGVILITTKQAKEGPMKLTYTSEYRMETWRRKPEVLSAEKFLAEGLGDDNKGNTNWMDELSHTPLSHRQVINLQGGSKVARVYSTFTISDQQGKIIGDRRRDWSGRVNANFSLFDNFLEIKTHTEYRESNRDQRANGDHMYMAIKLNPTIPAYDPKNPTGFNVLTGGWEEWNPLADIGLSTLTGIDRWVKADATFKLNLYPGLTSNSTIGYEMRDYDENRFVSTFHKASVDNGRRGEAKLYNDRTNFNTFESYFNYVKEVDDHNINATAGISFYQRDRRMYHLINKDFPVEAVGPWDMNTGTYLSDGRAEMKSLREARERLFAYFGRLNYTYQDKYMVTGSFRYEGSSKFDPKERWGTFWALSGGYRISEESFMKDIEWLNDLKLRVGYGTTGNNGFSTGLSRKLYEASDWWIIDGQWDKSYGLKHNPNPGLKWEEKTEWNFGLDYSLFNNRVYGKVDIYRRKVNGMIYDVSVPVPPAVKDRTTMNVGNLENTGWEFEIGGDIVNTKDFRYSSSMRFAQNKTKLKSLSGENSFEDRQDMPAPGSPGTAVRLQIGREIGSYYVWRYAGIDDNGNWLLYDKNNNVISAENKTNEDKAFVGNAIPALITSWDHNFVYKNWDLSIGLRSWIDFDVFNTQEMYLGIPNVKGQNVLAEYYEKNKHIKGEKQLSDYFVQDGTFLKIESINLGYLWKVNHKFFDSARFYLTVRDVAYFTKYKGLNPEIDINGLEPGFEWFRKQGGENDRGWRKSIYPQTINWTLGVQLTF